MHTQKVSKYPNIKFVNEQNKSILVLISILRDFKILTRGEAGVAYGIFVNIHYDLNRIEKNKDFYKGKT